MLQRTDGVALLSRLCPSCASPSNPGLTKVLSYLTKGTWQAELFKDINQPDPGLLIAANEAIKNEATKCQ